MNDKTILKIIGRDSYLFNDDLASYEIHLKELINKSSFLIIGGAGSIGSAVTELLFSFNPKKIHVIDLSENNLAELVRGLRSSIGYIKGEFLTFTLNYGEINFDEFNNAYGPYDYVLNFAALKHVRSERDNFTLHNMIKTNISYVLNNYSFFSHKDTKKYFTVSTDKAANPENLMGASKKIMESLMISMDVNTPVSFSRFANVAFSDGSLLKSFINRLEKLQPITAPNDIFRFFITPKESAILCIFSTIFGKNNELFIPKLNNSFKPEGFHKILTNYLNFNGYELFEVSSEESARLNPLKLIEKKKWPCYLFKSDTTGEKKVEEFHTKEEILIENCFKSINILKLEKIHDPNYVKNLNFFIDFQSTSLNIRRDFLRICNSMVPGFNYKDLKKNLDQKM